MDRQEALAVAQDMLGDSKTGRPTKAELANILLNELGDPKMPDHPIMDIADDYLTETFRYDPDDGDLLWTDKMALTKAIVQLMAKAVKNAR